MLHYSHPYENLKETISDFEKIESDFGAIERHHEIWDRNTWQPNFEREDYIETVYP